ncbi:MAG: hypothetical protein HGA62_04470 [Chlorobiaceae bacterium]|nr:hypothetical protein [Chlorobiaceae bacterium]NTV61518.1 hypothetical protein [Chlorobiaceae bacterium]
MQRSYFTSAGRRTISFVYLILLISMERAGYRHLMPITLSEATLNK